MPYDGAATRSNAELGSLVGAQRLRAMAVGWRVAAIVLAAACAMTGGLALLLWFATHLGAIVVGAAAVGLGAGAAAFGGRARARNADARAKLDEAWETVADEVVRARGDAVTAADLARTMRTDERHAEALLSRLSAGGRVRVDVRDDAELAYRVDAAEAAGEPARGPEPDEQKEDTARARRG